MGLLLTLFASRFGLNGAKDINMKLANFVKQMKQHQVGWAAANGLHPMLPRTAVVATMSCCTSTGNRISSIRSGGI